MKSFPSTFLYISIISFGIFFVVSSDNWFTMWFGLEMTMFGFLPLFYMNPLTSESVMMYFNIQAGASAMYLMGMLSSVNFNSELVLLSLVMKLGMFPFFQWVPLVMNNLSWHGCMMLSTMQKLAPFCVIMQINLTSNLMVMTISMISIIISGILGTNQAMIRGLMAYSTIMHSSWMMMALIISPMLFIIYMIYYFFAIYYLFSSFNKNNTNMLINTTNNNETLAQAIYMLVLAGIPPFIFFYMKLYIIMSHSTFMLMFFVMLFATIMSTLFYLSVTVPSIMMNKWIPILKEYKGLLLFLLIMSLPLIKLSLEKLS